MSGSFRAGSGTARPGAVLGAPPGHGLGDNGKGDLWFRGRRGPGSAAMPRPKAAILAVESSLRVTRGRRRLNPPGTRSRAGARPAAHPMESPVAITREHVLQALSTVAVDAAGTNLVASGRLSEVVVDGGGRVMFSIAIAPNEAAALERVRQ